MKNNTTNEIVIEYLNKYKDVPNRTLAKILYSKYPDLFLSVENARNRIRYFRGAKGKINKEYLIKKYGKSF